MLVWDLIPANHEPTPEVGISESRAHRGAPGGAPERGCINQKAGSPPHKGGLPILWVGGARIHVDERRPERASSELRGCVRRSGGERDRVPASPVFWDAHSRRRSKQRTGGALPETDSPPPSVATVGRLRFRVTSPVRVTPPVRRGEPPGDGVRRVDKYRSPTGTYPLSVAALGRLQPHTIAGPDGARTSSTASALTSGRRQAVALVRCA